MKPFKALPFQTLVTLLAIVVMGGTILLLWPRVALFIAIVVTVVWSVGAGLVALEVRVRGVKEASHVRTAISVFAVLSALLVMCCAPDMYVKDAGELTSAAHCLGVPHPTGFPLFVMLAKAMDLLPFGTTFFRVNCLSALSMALACATAFLLAFAIGPLKERPPLFVSATMCFLAALALSARGPWLHGTTTEVYALSAFGLLATCLFGALGAKKKDPRLFVFSAFLVGLGLGCHVTWPFEGALFLGVITFFSIKAFGRPLQVLFLMLVAFAMGFLVVLYLPASAMRDPVANWGNPSTLRDLVAHLSGERIRKSFASEVLNTNPLVLWARTEVLSRIVLDDFGPFLPLSLLGLYAVTKQSKAYGMAMALWLLADVAFAVLVNPMGIYDLQTSVPTFLVLGTLSGVGAAKVYQSLSGVLARGVAITIVIVGVLHFLGVKADRFMGNLWGPRAIVSEVLDNGPVLSSVLTSSDDLSAGLLAAQVVEGARPDMLVLVRQHIADTRYVERKVRAEEGLLNEVRQRPFEVSETKAQALRRLLELLSQRGEVFVELGEGDLDRLLYGRLSVAFPAYHLDQKPVATEARAREVLHTVASLASSCDRFCKAYLGTSARLLGVYLESQGLLAFAFVATSLAITLDDEDARSWHNLGVLMAERGDLRAAVEYLKRAVDLDPTYVRGYKTLARYAALAGEDDLALWAKEKAEALSH